MAKKKKKEPLVVGQHLWIETVPQFFAERERSVREYEVVEVNTNSAYIVAADEVNLPKPYTIRVDQRTHQVVNRFSAGYGYRTWYSQEQFENNIKYVEKFKRMREAAHDKIDRFKFSELQDFLEEEEHA